MRSLTSIALMAFLALLSIKPLEAQGQVCTGPQTFPIAGTSGPYCHKGRMGLAATEYAPVPQAVNLPRLRALDFARREAEMKARGALARFLNDSSMQETAVRSSAILDSGERQAWMTFVGETQVQTVRARLSAGIGVLAIEERDGAVYVTVATTPDMDDMVHERKTYRPDESAKRSSGEGNGTDQAKSSPFTVVPRGTSPWAN